MEISGLAPPSTLMISAIAPGSCCDTSQRHRASGSATVAESPMVCRPGARRRRRARPSDSRWPRFEVTSACSSSRITQRRSEKNRSASFVAISSASCSGVVSSTSGGLSFCRWRLCRGRVAGAGLHGYRQIHLGHRRRQVAFDVDGQGLERRDIERVDAAHGFARPAFRPARDVDQRRQEPGKRLSGTGRGDQQNRPAGL